MVTPLRILGSFTFAIKSVITRALLFNRSLVTVSTALRRHILPWGSNLTSSLYIFEIVATLVFSNNGNPLL